MSKGTSQNERMPAALDPESFKLDGRSVRDLFIEARALAESIDYYETAGKDASGNWSPFFDQEVSFAAGKDLSEWDETGELPPHLGLFGAFLTLFGYNQDQLNALTASHLYFFYNTILGQEKREAIPDNVFVFFELARNVQHYLLPERSLLTAGKDDRGKEVLYTTDRQIVLSHANISSFKAIHNQKKADGSIIALPVANSLDGFGAPLEEGEGWAPFGNPGTGGSSANIGFAIGSPVLFLKEGIRTIHISLSLAEAGNNTAELDTFSPGEFSMMLTGPEGWFAKEMKAIQYRDRKLIFSVELDEMDPAIIAYVEELHGSRLSAADRPLLIVTFKDGYRYSRYALIQSLRVERITVRTEVEKVRSLLVKNDFGELDAGRSFQPFGYTPVKGANLYLGYEEIFLKSLSELSIRINWQGLPENFKTWYEGYLGPTNSLVNRSEDFKVKASIRHQKEWFEIKNRAENAGEFPLFGEKLHFVLDESKNKLKQYIPYRRAIENADGLIRLTLSSPSNGFGHSLYPSVYAKAIMSQLQDKANPIPNEPHTPVAESVELAYTAEEETDRFYYINPFGSEQVPVKNTPLLSGEFHHAGILYLGIEKLNPPQQLSVFFDIEQEHTEEKPEPDIYYLSHTGWTRLPENQVLSDTTLGLKQTGILLLNLPPDMAFGNPLMPAGTHWVRISVPGNPGRFDRIVSVKTNAVSCMLHDESLRNSVNVNALPPGSMQGFSKKIAGIKNIEQPYSSFGGRPAENEADYFTRVSEKLRHRMRSITAWDYERMILERFPEIYKVTCLPHRDEQGRVVPGNVHIIIIPFLKQLHLAKSLKPMAANSTLTEIKTYIERFSSSGIKVQVTNPRYEEIKVIAQVSFNIRVDAGFYTEQLQSDLQRFLSPWAFRKEMDIQLGSKLYRSSVIEFIESRSYVDFIASIRLLKNGRFVEEEEISPDLHTLIVSSDTHEIEAVVADRLICQTNQGVEQMIVDINFEVQ